MGVMKPSAARKQITTTGLQSSPTVKQPPHDYMFREVTVREPGFAYVFVSNEHPTYVDVYFDDVTVTHTPSPIVSASDYFAFGLQHTTGERAGVYEQRYLYNSKELQDELNMGWLDYGARMYQPDLSRFLAQDRFAEKYYALNAYQYAANNPVLFVDINGDSVWIKYNGANILYQNGGLYNKDGTAYTGKGTKTDKNGNVVGYRGFLGQAFNALIQISAAETGAGTTMLSDLQASTNNFVIDNASNNPRAAGENEFVPDNRNAAYAVAMLDAGQGQPQAGGSGGTIYWNPTGGAVNELGGGIGIRPTTNLAHELFHGYDSNRGLLDNRPVNGLKRDEWRASYFENQMRIQMGLPLRSTYNTRGGPVQLLTPVHLPFGGGTPIHLPTQVAPPTVTWMLHLRFR